jgi:hypothetical protein
VYFALENTCSLAAWMPPETAFRVSELEREINKRVAELYGNLLTREENP